MSLLPGQILPETVPIGTTGIEPNADGSLNVTMNHQWWLFLYNLFRNTLLPTSPTANELIGTDFFIPRVPILPANPSPAGDQIRTEIFFPRSQLVSQVQAIIVPPNDENSIIANQIFGA